MTVNICLSLVCANFNEMCSVSVLLTGVDVVHYLAPVLHHL